MVLSFILEIKERGWFSAIFCLSLSSIVITLMKLHSHVYIFYYYTTARSRVQIMMSWIQTQIICPFWRRFFTASGISIQGKLFK